MTTDKVKSKFDEPRFLNQNSTGALFLGIAIILNFFDNVLFAGGDRPMLLGALMLVLFFVGVFLYLRSYRVGPKFFSKSYWFIVYEDEFLNHLNMKGFKWAANALMFVLIVFWTCADFIMIPLEQRMGLRDLAGLGIGTFFIAYSLPILYELKSNR